MTLLNDLREMTARQFIGCSGDDDKCPCCGNPIFPEMKKRYLEGITGYCGRCGCRYNKFGIVGWET